MRKHLELRRVEVPWPIDLTRVRPLATDSTIDLDPDSSPSIWVQALVHPERLPRTMTDLEAVKYLMGGYFHQDWVLDGGESSDTVASFLHERRELVVTCADQLDELLGQDFPDGGLEAQLVEWGCAYYAGDTDQDYRRWLGEIGRQLRDASSKDDHVDDLTHLFSAYFYEAWDEYEYDSWEDAADDFARRSPDRVAGAVVGLQALLDEPLADGELDERLRTLGCTFVSDQGDRAWLLQLRDRLRSESEGTQSLSRAN